jgi:hypothetical protein
MTKQTFNLKTGVMFMKMHLAAAVVLMMLIPAGVLAEEVPTNVTLTPTETTNKVDWNGDTEDDGYYN